MFWKKNLFIIAQFPAGRKYTSQQHSYIMTVLFKISSDNTKSLYKNFHVHAYNILVRAVKCPSALKMNMSFNAAYKINKQCLHSSMDVIKWRVWKFWLQQKLYTGEHTPLFFTTISRISRLGKLFGLLLLKLQFSSVYLECEHTRKTWNLHPHFRYIDVTFTEYIIRSF
jgi:hypothetical protein